ncbi:GIP [Symbiodinium microadriaticum]|nr:GIP [Symbiodinium microadriaticum]
MTQLGGDLLPLLEFLQALAEEPFSRRLLVDGSRRSRFLLALLDRQPVILAALVEAVRRSANEATLSAAAAWLRAQSLYEEWLPMIGIDAPGRGVHSALTTLSPIFQGEVLRVAKLEFGLPALEACAALVAAALPLVGSAVPETDPRRLPDRILGPLLAALGELCRGLPGMPHNGVQPPDAADVAGVLLTVLHSAFSLPLTLCSESFLPVLTEMGVRLLVVTGPRGGAEVDVEGGLLGRAFDAWEVLANGLRSEPSSASLDVAAATAYAQLLCALPVALKLPLDLPADQGPKAAAWGVRGRIAQVLTVWCSGAAQRQGEAVAKLRELQVQSGSAALDTATGLADLEMVLTFGSAVAEMCSSTAEMESELPVPLTHLLMGLPRVLALQPAEPWASVLEASAAELICSLDTWISSDRYPPTGEVGRLLLTCSFQLASSPRATAPAIESLCVVVSNFSGALAQRPELAEPCCRRLTDLCIGQNPLGATSRERAARSALAPLLSRLEEVQLASVVEAFVAPLRSAAPPSADPAGLVQRVVLWRLFFNLLASTEPARPELSLEWLSQHWPWMEAALGCHSESACEAAVTLLTSVLSRTRNSEASQSVLLQAFPVLAQSAAERGSAAALQGVVSVTRMFRGGTTTEAANFMAQHILAIARRLLPSLAKAQDLPPDLLAALLEAFTVALAPRCKLLASQLMASPEILAALLQPVCGLLCNCASPRLACWSLMLVDRFPAWLQHAETAASARKLLEISLPWACEAFLSLLTSAPVVRDTEVSQTLAQALISIHRAMGSSFTAAMARGLSALGLQEEGGFLLQQLADSGLTEETLAEALRDAADAWQAEELRKLSA